MTTDPAAPATTVTVEAPSGLLATYRSVWRHRRWRWLAGSTVVSTFGDTMYVVAITVVLLDGPDGAAWLSLGLLARLVPYVVLGPIGGVVADRYDRRVLLVGLSAVRGVLFVAMAGVLALDGPRLVLVLLLALNASAGAFFEPARQAAIPQLVPEGDLAAANAAEQGLSQISWFVGPALGALLVAAVDAEIVLAIEAATFVVESVMLVRIGRLAIVREPVPGDGAAGSLFRDMWRDIRAGGAFAFGERGVRGLVLMNAVATLAFGAEQILYVLVADERMGLGPEGIGYLLTAMGIGGMAAAPLSARAGSSGRAGRWLLVSGALLGLPMVLISVFPMPAVVFPLVVVEGGAAIVFDVAVLTLLQRGVPESAMGRVASVNDALGTLGQTIGSVGAPGVVALVGLAWGLRVSGGIMVAAVVVLTPAVLYLAARTDAERRRLAGVTAELARVDALAAFEPIELERLARASRVRQVAAGTRVIVAGDEPDDLYVVRSGRLGVVVADAAPGSAVPPDLGAGDLFGEIGLMRSIPRTATVTALTDAELTVVDGAVFTAVAHPGPNVEPLLGVARTRLSRTNPSLLDDSLAEVAP